MGITQTQLQNIIGYINHKLIFIFNMRAIVLNPNSLPSDITTANNNALSVLDDLQILLNTVYTNLGRTQPNTTLTLTQLQNMGLT